MVMRKSIIYVLLSVAAFQGCVSLKTADPYEEALCRLTVAPQYPEGYPDAGLAGADVTITERNRGYVYSVAPGADGQVSVVLPKGSYRVVLNYSGESIVYNGTADRLILSGDSLTVNLNVRGSRKGEIVFKEIYCGGCTKYPEQGNYAFDSYVILHNNTGEVQYLDSLCFGTVDPYRSTGTSVWVSTDPETKETVFPEFLPVVQAIWQIGGSGHTFPLGPGEDAVIVVYGAIDHASKYPESVNLNKAEYFVCYNRTYFHNEKFHPEPGNNINRKDHILDVVIKTGKADAYTFAVSSPAPIIFRTPAGTSIYEWVNSPDNVIQKPGSTIDRIVKIPPEWVLDGVEVFESGGSNKRLVPWVDAGAVVFSGPYYGHTLFRHTDEASSAAAGYEVLMDTNNSTIDFYEREKQSLHE